MYFLSISSETSIKALPFGNTNFTAPEWIFYDFLSNFRRYENPDRHTVRKNLQLKRCMCVLKKLNKKITRYTRQAFFSYSCFKMSECEEKLFSSKIFFSENRWLFFCACKYCPIFFQKNKFRSWAKSIIFLFSIYYFLKLSSDLSTPWL